MLEKLNVENRTLAKITYPFRHEKRLIDSDSLREAVINAFVHNDYSDLMSPAFYIFVDRVEIVSYGGLIDGMSKEELVSGCSRPRNREIMRIFKDVELVEQLGTGMNRMMKAYTPDIFSVSPNFFHTVFIYRSLESENVPNVPNDVPNVPNDVPNDNSAANKLSERLKIILTLLKNDGFLSLASIAKECDVSEKTIKRDIADLKEMGLIRREGTTRGRWIVLDNKPY